MKKSWTVEKRLWTGEKTGDWWEITLIQKEKEQAFLMWNIDIE